MEKNVIHGHVMANAWNAVRFKELEKKSMEIIIKLVVRYYLRAPSLYGLLLTKTPTFRAGLFAFLNEICYLLKLTRSYRLTSLSIEVTNYCNLHCELCPNSTMKRSRGYIDGTLYKKIVDTNTSIEYLFLFLWGEPFLHRHIFDFIHYAASRGIRTMVTTNGTIISKDAIPRILDSGLERLTFSIDGSRTTHAQLRHCDYDQLKSTILELKKMVSLKKSSLQIDVSMVVCEKTENDIDTLKHEWGKVVDRIYFIPRLISGLRKERCRELWRGNLTVLWDGRVVPCCVDFNGMMVVGNARFDSLTHLWNGEQMQKLRRLQRRRSFPPICSQCSEYKKKGISNRFT